MRFAGGRLPALWAAAPVGIVLALAIAGVAVATGSAGPRPLAGGVVVALFAVWPCVGLVWATVVDRDTLHGAASRPEQSVESAWYERAASGAFTDTLIVAGLGTAALAVTGAGIPAVLALVGVVVVAMGSFGARYLAQRRRG